MDKSPHQLAEEAIRCYERILAERPDETHHPLSIAARTVFRLRDLLIERQRRHGESRAVRSQLERANALTSLAYSCQFPIAGVKWQRMEATRDALKDFVKELSAREDDSAMR
jgi:hypothetical protein